MEFKLLGPLEVRKHDRVLPVGGAKQRALLAILLLHANEVVSRDRLIDELWAERPPGTADHSLDHQVSRLRKSLDLADLLLTRSGGYVLEIDPAQIDARRFERLLEQGRRANAEGKSAEAAEVLGEALALWRGRALADLAYEPFARGEIERLEELRLAAIEERIDAELALGRHQALVAELESLTAKHPLRERLRAQLMLALYRSGRQAEALRVYADTRRKLVDELGIEPGQALGDLERAILRHDASLELPPRAETEKRPQRRRRAILTALALALAGGAAAIGVLLAGGAEQNSNAQSLTQPNSVALVWTATGRVIGRSELQAPLLSRFGEGALWNLSSKGILTKIDPTTAKVIASVNAVPVPCGLAVGEGSVWVSDCGSPTLVQVDPEQTVVVNHITLPTTADPKIATQTGEVAVGAGSVWVGQGFTNPSYVWRLDPRTGHVLKRYLIPEGGAEALAFGDGALWVAGSAIGRLSRIDPRTNERTTPVRDFGSWLCCISVGGGYIWAAVNPTGKIWKTSESGQVVSDTKLARNIEDLTYADGAVWASAGEAGTVVRIDPTTDSTRAYRLGHHVVGVAVRKGVLAASVQPVGQALTTDLKGRIVQVALKEDDLDSNTSTDPLGIQSFNAAQMQFHYATCAKLFNYPDASGAAGERLMPEVAAGWPKVTDRGRTYTFRIRPGYGFSPPSDEAVTAASFRHEIERVLSPNGSGPSGLLSDVVGAKAYTEGKTAHVSGISAHGDTLVIRLVKPAGDLLERLALPSFCAVPVNLPTVAYGLPYPIPTAGPYYLADRSSDVFVLKPNPNYNGPRPRRLDAIVYRTGIDTGRAAAQIAQDMTDYMQEADPVLAPNTEASRGAGSRYRLTANNWTERLALNTSRPLFADIQLRRAVAYALDRPMLAHAIGSGEFQLPTNQLLPPNLRGADAAPGYPSSPDLPAARRLMADRHLHAVFAAYAPAAGSVSDPEFVRALRKQLAAIGITLTVVPLRQNYSPAKYAAVLAHADITHTNRNAGNASDPVDYLLDLPYLPADDRAKLARIAALPTPRRESAAKFVAARLERDAVYLGLSDGATPELVSKRLGCIIDQPEYPGLDLAALCLRR